METIGIILISVAAWIIYAAYKGFNPAKTGFEILQNPANAAAILLKDETAARQELASALASTDTTAPDQSGAGVASGTASADAAKVVAFARSQVGKPYVLGGSGPNSWDCSGLVQAAYALVGIKVLHSALAQSLRGTAVRHKKDLVAGDLLFPTGWGVAAIGDHVQIYSGAGTVIEAANEQVGVREISLSHWWPSEAVVARRYIVQATTPTGAPRAIVGSGGSGVPR